MAMVSDVLVTHISPPVAFRSQNRIIETAMLPTRAHIPPRFDTLTENTRLMHHSRPDHHQGAWYRHALPRPEPL